MNVIKIYLLGTSFFTIMTQRPRMDFDKKKSQAKVKTSTAWKETLHIFKISGNKIPHLRCRKNRFLLICTKIGKICR